ncbi:MAG: hypothetical protein KDD51_04420 [Bdellovibrionales bacterium]|nr:hypothetical protein [Bdellovibrionales bacterium]
MKRLWVLLGVGLWLSTQVLAATATTETTGGQITGGVDIRPSVAPYGEAQFFTENTIEAGYKFNDKFSMGYVQGFYTNLHNHSKDFFYLDVGFLKASVANLYVSDDESLSLSYSTRLYTPTRVSSREAGFITANRHYFTLSKKFSDAFTLSGSQVTVFYVYDRAGSGTSAHPLIENRFYLLGDVTLAKGLTLSLPLMFHQTRYRRYQAGAKNNDAWGLFLWTWPELLYSVTEKTAVGLSYYSDNLLEADGLAKGVAQITLQAKL